MIIKYETLLSYIFQSFNPFDLDLEPFLEAVDSRFCAAQLVDMDASFTLSEIKRAVFDKGDDKSTGPDGFDTAFFLQKTWSIVGNEVSKICLSILNEGESVWELNKKHVMYIPKLNGPKKITEC